MILVVSFIWKYLIGAVLVNSGNTTLLFMLGVSRLVKSKLVFPYVCMSRTHLQDLGPMSLSLSRSLKYLYRKLTLNPNFFKANAALLATVTEKVAAGKSRQTQSQVAETGSVLPYIRSWDGEL